MELRSKNPLISFFEPGVYSMCAVTTRGHTQCTRSDCWAQVDIEALRQHQQVGFCFPGMHALTCKTPYLGPLPPRNVVCTCSRDIPNSANAPSRHPIPWPCCGSRLEPRDLEWHVGPPFKLNAQMLLYLLSASEGPGVLILSYLGRHLACHLLSPVWRDARLERTLPNFMALNVPLSNLKSRAPAVVYSHPVQRVLLVTTELTNFISRAVRYQKTVAAICGSVHAQAYNAIYSLRTVGKGNILHGDGAPASEYSGDGMWDDATSLADTWRAQMRHRETHHIYYKHWKAVMGLCSNDFSRLCIAYHYLGKELYSFLLPHSTCRVVLDVVARATAVALEPVWYPQDREKRRGSRYHGAAALQHGTGSILPSVFWDYRRCAICPTSPIEWESIASWSENNRVTQKDVSDVNDSNPEMAQRHTLWGHEFGQRGELRVLGHLEDNSHESKDTEPWTTPDVSDPAYCNGGWDGQDPAVAREDEDARFQTWLESDAHWEAPPETKTATEYDTTDTEEMAPGSNAAVPIEVSDNEDVWEGPPSPPRLRDSMFPVSEMDATSDVIYETDQEGDDGHGRADMEDYDSPFMDN